MKHVSVIATVLAVLCLALATSTSATWLTYRDDVAVNSGTVDIDAESINTIVNETITASTNVSLPCNLTNLNQTLTVFRINTSGTNVTFNLTVNGVAVNSSSNINWTTGNWSNVTLAMCISAGVDTNDTYIDVTTNASGNATVFGRIYADDASVTSDWLTANVVVTEKDVADPYVGPTIASSWWVVNDSVAVSNELGYNISDVNLSLTYPSHTISEPFAYINFGVLEYEATETSYVQYQKRGPYVFSVSDSSSGTSHTVTVLVNSNELLTNCVDYELDPTDDVYNGAFDTLNYNTLTVKYNGVSIDWNQGSIELESLTTNEAQSQNSLVFTWSTTPSGAPPGTGDGIPADSVESWYNVPVAGLSIWVWIILIVAILAVAVVFFKYMKD